MGRDEMRDEAVLYVGSDVAYWFFGRTNSYSKPISANSERNRLVSKQSNGEQVNNCDAEAVYAFIFLS